MAANSQGYSTSSNYQSNGYPSIYGIETHSSSVMLQMLGSTSVPANSSIYHDCGVKIYGSDTSTSIGSTSTIRINSQSPYIDFTNASYMVPSTITSQMNSAYSGFSILTDFKVEIYKNGTLYFHAGASTTMTKSDSNLTFDKVTYDKNGTYIDSEIGDVTFDNPTIIDFSKLGKIASSLYSGNYDVKVTYSYLWVKGDTSTTDSSSWNMAFIKTTSTQNTSLVIDYTNPTLTVLKTLDSSKVESGTYSNSAVKVSASDTNFKYLYYKKPNQTTYSANSSTSITSTTDTGWHYFYAVDQNGNKSNEFSVYIDTYKPEGKIYANGVEVESGSYINSNFSYSATDTGSGIKGVYYKTPSSSTFVPYSSGSIIPSTLGDGWYEFYSIDNAGNESNHLKIYLETSIPVINIIRNGEVVYTYQVLEGKTIDTGLYFNEDDSIKFEYVSSSNVYKSGSFNVGSNYTLNKTFYPNSSYSETITSATGVSSTFKFNIVRSKPYLTIDGTDYEDGSTIKFNKDLDIVMNIDSSISSGTNTATILCDNNKSTYDLLSNRNVTLSAETNEVKEYQITLTDAAGNTSTFNVIIDKEASNGVFTSNNVIIENNGYTNKPFLFSFEDATCVVSKDGGVSKAYNDEVISEDGTYSFILTDDVGNTSEFRITLDSVKPSGTFYVENIEQEGEVITNKSFYFTWDGDDTCLVNGKSYKKNTVISEEGKYSFILTDKAGNSVTYTAEIDKSAPTGNEDKLINQDNYTVSKWYEVNYNGNKDCYKTLEEANKKASEYEYSDFVTELILDDISKFNEYSMVASNNDSNNHDDEVRTGTYWLYKSIANPDIKLYYFDKALLDETVSYYAKEYVSGPHYFDSTSKAGGEEVISTTFSYEDIEAPIGNTYILENFGSDNAYAVSVGTDTKISLNYSDTLGSQLDDGLYEIFETDKAGNTCSYKVIIDKKAPKLNIKTETYNENSEKEFVLDNDTMPTSKTFYLKSFEIKSIIDSDPYSVVKITYNGITSYYTFGDDLPTLTDGGKYEISVYDRVDNVTSFSVYISSEEENIEFKNNSDDTSVSINITLPESNTTITSLEIYRNGEKLDNVTPDKLNYEFSKDGNYKVILKDNFGRTIEKEYYFHKAKPEGILSGVDNGSKTNSDVSFSFDLTKYYACVYKDGKLIETNKTGTVFINANNINSGSYEIILIRLDDEENYSFYNFVLDTISPDVSLTGVEDKETTNGSVSVSWTDFDVKSATYSINGSEEVSFSNNTTFDKEGIYQIKVIDDLGNITIKTFTIDKTVDYKVLTSDNKELHGDATTSSDISIKTLEDGKVTVIRNGETYNYIQGEYITKEGSYLITVEDNFGNKTSFTIVIDKSVDFTMNVGNGGIINEAVTITSNEAVSVTITKDSKPYSYNLGDEITEEGFYKVLISDAYGNTKEVTFQIVYKDARTSINYDLGDDVKITKVTKDGKEVGYDSNHLAFMEDGEYVIYYSENGIDYTFTLNLDTTAPEITLIGVEDGGKVDATISISNMTEEGTITVYKDGEVIDYKLGDEIKDYGSYKVVVKDILGNTRTYSFTLEFQMNAWAIALITVGVITSVGVVAFIVMKRKKVFKK